MAVIRTQLEGAAALDRVLKQLPEKVARNVLRRAVTKGAKVVEAEMRDRAPVGPTGNLKASITQRGVKTKDKRISARRDGAARYRRTPSRLSDRRPTRARARLWPR